MIFDYQRFQISESLYPGLGLGLRLALPGFEGVIEKKSPGEYAKGLGFPAGTVGLPRVLLAFQYF